MTRPDEHPFRFGINLRAGTREKWAETCRKAEGLGYDVLGVPDHLGFTAPFPAVLAAAEATQRARITTVVLNTAFYNPTLLARDVASIDQFSDGRFELGLGAGYAKEEFDTAGIPFGTATGRVAHLEAVMIELRSAFADPQYQPRPANPSGPPVLLAGNGDRLLRVAAQHADIIGFAANAPARKGEPSRMADHDVMDERVGYVRDLLGEARGRVEFNMLAAHVAITDDRRQAAKQFVRASPMGAFPPDLDVDTVLDLPGLLFGTAQQIAEQLRANRERYGISYVTVLGDAMDEFAKVIELLK